jgi:hypothetical protein
MKQLLILFTMHSTEKYSSYSPYCANISWVSLFTNVYYHDAKIRGGGKTVHVVFKYAVCSEANGRGKGGVSHAPLCTSQLICGYLFKEDDVTIILLLGVSFMSTSIRTGDDNWRRLSKPSVCSCGGE